MAKGTGAGGSFVFNGVNIPFNSIEPDVQREMDDSSDSTNYDPVSGIVHKAQLPVSTQTTFSIEGKINLATVPAALVVPLYGGATAVPISVNYNGTAVYGHGFGDITNFKGTIDPMKVLTYTATVVSNGIFIPGS